MRASPEWRVTDLEKAPERLAESQSKTEESLRSVNERMAASDARSRAEIQESRAERREFNKKLGEMSNKFGTLVQDIVLPNIPGLFAQLFHEEPDIFFRVTKRKPSDWSQTCKFDAVLSGEATILFVETKSALKPEDVPRWTGVLETVRSFFPDAAEKKIFGALASFYLGRNTPRFHPPGSARAGGELTPSR